MELQQVADRYAEAIEEVDLKVNRAGVNSRTGIAYWPGFKSLKEARAVQMIDEAWSSLHPGEMSSHRTSVSYPHVQGASCDHVVTTDDPNQDADEWGVEVKRLQFVGDNGKENGYQVGKVLSPYLKDRGVLHDAARLREHGFTRRVAVIGYSFDYDADSLQKAERRHQSTESRAVLAEVSKVVKKNGGALLTRPLIEFADAILVLRGFTTGPRAQSAFRAWRHPAGGRGVVFGWEVRRPHLEQHYDPRHPW